MAKPLALRQASLPALPVRRDRARLVQCVSNILTTSAKYTDAHGRIEIALHRLGEQAVLSVQDNGREAGFDAHMVKPADVGRVLEALNT